MLRAAGPPRPSAFALLLREEPDTDADEVRALDPIRVLLAHPTWRRALGFAYFDDDPALVAGETYEYRISADFPAEDVRDPDHGFSTVGSGVVLPTDFTLDGVRLRLPQPTPSRSTQRPRTEGLVRLTRRGIALNPERAPFWLTPSLDDWSLVVDFPTPAAAVVLELEEGHELEFAAGAADDSFNFGDAVASRPAAEVHLREPNRPTSPARQRISVRGKDLHRQGRPARLSTITPPIVLAATAPPLPPLLAWATNLQTSSTAPADLVPAGDVPPRHALGFTVLWRPAPAFALNGWPADLEARPHWTRRSSRSSDAPSPPDPGDRFWRRELDAGRPGQRYPRSPADTGLRGDARLPGQCQRALRQRPRFEPGRHLRPRRPGVPRPGDLRALPGAGDRRGRPAQRNLDRERSGEAGEAPAACRCRSRSTSAFSFAMRPT